MPVIKEQGWEGKSKGFFPITAYVKTLTLNGHKDPETGIQQGTLLGTLFKDCNDCKNELSALKPFGQEIGVTVDDVTQKYHAELANEV